MGPSLLRTDGSLTIGKTNKPTTELGDSIVSQEEGKEGGAGAGEGAEQHQKQQHHHRPRHHPFWPLHTEDFWGLLFTALGLMIAAGGGIGGGGAWGSVA